jgi:hypothetical protein
MRKLTIYLLCFLIAFCPACQSFWTPERKSLAQSQLDSALASGQITQAQHDAATEALTAQPNTFNWAGLGSTAENILLGVLGVPITVGLAANQLHSAKTKALVAQAKALATPPKA